MKTDIVIRTQYGPVLLNPTTPETFDLVGPPLAVEEVQNQLPAWFPAGNAIAEAADNLARLLYLRAADTEDRPTPKLVSHETMQKRTLTENPIVLFQVRDDAAADWRTDRVMIDDDDLNRFVENQPHRYQAEHKDLYWRGFVVPCVGHLAAVVKQARDIANA
jgi:hypothetical protein